MKSQQLDAKMAKKESAYKEDRIAELKGQVSELQKLKVDKVETIKNLQSMLQKLEASKLKQAEAQEELRVQIKEHQDEAAWLKKELESVSAVVTQTKAEAEQLKQNLQE